MKKLLKLLPALCAIHVAQHASSLAGDFAFNALSVGTFEALSGPPMIAVRIQHPAVKAGIFEFDTLLAEQKVNVLAYPNQITDGKITFTTGSGDKLEAIYAVPVNAGASPGELIAEGPFQFAGGTGLFAGASGGGTIGAVIAFQGATNGVSAITWSGNLRLPETSMLQGAAGAFTAVTGPASGSQTARQMTLGGAGDLEGLGNFAFSGNQVIDFGVPQPPFPITQSQWVLTMLDNSTITLVQDGAGSSVPDGSDASSSWMFPRIPYRIAGGTDRLAHAAGRLWVDGSLRTLTAPGVSGSLRLTGLIRFPEAPSITKAGIAPGGAFAMEFTGNGVPKVSSSADLKSWTDRGQGEAVSPGRYRFLDPEARLTPNQSYRVTSE